MLTSSVGWSAAMPADMIEVFESYGENGTAGEEGGGEPQDGFSDGAKHGDCPIVASGTGRKLLQWNRPPTPHPPGELLAHCNGTTSRAIRTRRGRRGPGREGALDHIKKKWLQKSWGKISLLFGQSTSYLLHGNDGRAAMVAASQERRDEDVHHDEPVQYHVCPGWSPSPNHILCSVDPQLQQAGRGRPALRRSPPYRPRLCSPLCPGLGSSHSPHPRLPPALPRPVPHRTT